MNDYDYYDYDDYDNYYNYNDKNGNHVGRDNVFRMNNNDESNHENSLDDNALILDTNTNNDERERERTEERI